MLLFIRNLHARATVAPKADPLLAKLVEAVTEHYAGDPTAPSVIVSKLDSGFYASVVRYHALFAQRKEPVVKTSGHETPEAAVRALSEAWLTATRPKKSARGELAETLSAK